jgi:hypothetical protein
MIEAGQRMAAHRARAASRKDNILTERLLISMIYRATFCYIRNFTPLLWANKAEFQNWHEN